MVVLYTDEQLDRDLTINGENKSGYSLRRTSARVKTREASDSSPSPSPPPAERKRTVPASSKMGRIEKKIKTENAETKATALVAGGGGNSDESATFAVEKSAYAKVTETLRKFNKYYLNFIQVVKSVFDELMVVFRKHHRRA